jgi:hypothetical protein
MIKLGKTAQGVLAIGVLAVVVVGSGAAYSHEMVVQSQLNSDIARAQQDFVKYVKQKSNLEMQKGEWETRLSQANLRIAVAQKQFPKPTESIETSNALFQAATNAGVTITRLNSSAARDERQNGITFRVVSTDIIAEGEVPTLINFSKKVSERFPSVAVQSMGINTPKAVEDGGQAKPTIALRLKFYTYEAK